MAQNQVKVNPYTFVPLSDQNVVRKGKSEWEKGSLTGVLECSLTTITPLVIPDSDNVVEKYEGGEPKYEFYSYDGNQPVIPGSSLKGTIRNYYEAIHNMCLSSVDKNYRMVKRTPMRVNIKPCIIVKKDGKWRLFRATSYKAYCHEVKSDQGKFQQYEKFDLSLKEGTQISFNSKITYMKKNRKSQKLDPVRGMEIITERVDDGKYTGYFHRTEMIGNKHFESIFVKDHNDFGIEVSDSLIEDYLSHIKTKVEEHDKKDEEHDKKDDTTAGIFKDYINCKEQKGMIFAYYKNIEGKIYLRYSAIGAEMQFNKLESNIGNNHLPCEDDLCEACYIFGSSTKEKKASQISFSDAYTKEAAPYLETLVHMPMSERPRVTSTEFYFKKPENVKDISHFTSDYYTSKKEEFKHDSKISGRKFYWHHVPRHDHPDKRDYFRAVKPDVNFTFTVNFKHLTQAQLNKLITSLDLEYYRKKNEDDILCHKLGRGKPFGYGTVKLKVEKMFLYSKENGAFIESPVEVSGAQSIDDTLYSVLNFNSKRDCQITYNLGGDGKIFSFFANNRKEKIRQWLKEDGTLSRREDDDKKAVNKKGIERLKTLDKNKTYSGTVKKIEKVGLFVDIGIGVNGLVHIREISNEIIQDIHNDYNIGDIVQVKVSTINLQSGKYNLTMKDIK